MLENKSTPEAAKDMKKIMKKIDNIFIPSIRETARENPFKDEFYLFEEYSTKTNWNVVYQKACDFPKGYSVIFYNIR